MWLNTVIILNIIILPPNIVIAQTVGQICKLNNAGAEGICAMLQDCEAAQKEIKATRRHSFRMCIFNSVQEIICCPRAMTPPNIFDSTDRSNTNQRFADRVCQKILAEGIPHIKHNIIGGEEASFGEFPHMVAIGRDRGNGYEFDCGGSLVSDNFVLTAAHCVDTSEGIEPSMVRVGVVELGGSGWDPKTDVGISALIIHPLYSRREKYHDLALLMLNESLLFSGSVSPVCLETREGNPTTPLIITGWGKNSNIRNSKSNILLKANVSVVDNQRCGESYTNWRKLPRGIAPEQLCAGDPDGLRDTCQGDSGGPLQGSDSAGNYRLVGVTSFGRGCGSPVPGVYTRIARYLDWIESIVWPQRSTK